MTTHIHEQAVRREDQDIDTLACGCPADTPVRQVDEHDVQCTGCGLVSA